MENPSASGISLELSSEEHAVLLEILENYLSDLRMEIVDTDSIEFKKGLRIRKQVILDLLEKLRP